MSCCNVNISISLDTRILSVHLLLARDASRAGLNVCNRYMWLQVHSMFISEQHNVTGYEQTGTHLKLKLWQISHLPSNASQILRDDKAALFQLQYVAISYSCSLRILHHCRKLQKDRPLSIGFNYREEMHSSLTVAIMQAV